jgi:polysaccharide deacetylase family protein (PEP-CTERM system associated)
MKPEVTNALSFDLEHWFTATLLRDEVTNPQHHVEESVQIVLDILSTHDTRATFFVVGELAMEYPELVRRLVEMGHEVGTHGRTHRPLNTLSREEFAEEIDESLSAIESACGVRPDGFRAPNFSVNPETTWAFDVLEAADMEYDSSVFPTWTPMYGVPTAPVRPYRAAPYDRFRETTGSEGLSEVPLAVYHPRVRFPIAGGFYARTLSNRIISRGISNLNDAGLPATLYFHPWEFNPAVVDRSVSLTSQLISFSGIRRLPRKLRWLLERHEFGTVGRVSREWR